MLRIIRLATAGALYSIANRLLVAAGSSINRDKIVAYIVFRFYGRAFDRLADAINPLDIRDAPSGQYPAPAINEVVAVHAQMTDLGGNRWMVVVRSGAVVRQCTLSGTQEDALHKSKELAVEVGEFAVQ